MKHTKYMTCFKSAIATTIILLSIPSCGDKYHLKKSLKEFVSTEIVVPSDLQVITATEYKPIGDLMPKGKHLIIYHNAESCSLCNINHIEDHISLYELADTDGRFDIMEVFSPSIEDQSETEKALVLKKFPYPLYLDLFGSFRECNSHIPNDLRMNTFLIDSNGKILFVGDPMRSDKLMELFLAAL